MRKLRWVVGGKVIERWTVKIVFEGLLNEELRY